MNVLTRGLVIAVCYRSAGRCEAYVDGHFRELPEAAADVALSAKRSTPPREIEIVEGDGTWQTRTVRVVPVVVVKARGRVDYIREEDEDCSGGVSLRTLGDLRRVDAESMRTAARAFADGVEVEIVSIEGGPDMVRRVP